MNANDTITTRQLREILFYVSDQKTTVEQLRSMLFAVDDQDGQIQIGFDMFTKLFAELTISDTRHEQLHSEWE